jgi:hypothetical protein
MLLSLIVYSGTAIALAWLGRHVSHREQQQIRRGGAELPFWSWEILVAIFIYVVVSALRWQTSWDYNMYYSYYLAMQSLGKYSRENFEPGFSYLTMAMARSGMHFAFYFAFWAVVHIILLYYALRHRKVLLPWVALCLLMGPLYIQWMNAVRQAVVECLMLVMVELIVRRKFWIYLALSLLAMSIHRISVVLIPLYFIPLIPLRGGIKKWVPYALVLSCVVLGLFPQWIQWCFERVGYLASLLGYGHYYRLFTSNDSEYVFWTVMGPARLFPLISCMIIIWLYPSIRRFFKGDRYLSAIYKLSLVYIGYVNLFASTTLYLRRPGELLRGVFLVLVCYALCYLWRERRWIPFAALAFLNLYYVYYEIAKATIHPTSVLTPELYHTFLF